MSSRRPVGLAGLVVATLVVCGSGVLPAQPQAPIRLATTLPANSLWDQVLHDLAAEWGRASAGRVAVRITRLGDSEPTIIRKLNASTLDAASLSVFGLADLDPAFKVFTIPFFYNSYEELDVVQERLTPLLRARLEAKGLVLLHFGTAGWIHLFSASPVRTVGQLKSLRMAAVGADEPVLQWYRSNGFQPLPLALPDVLSGLQNGRIGAVSSTPFAALSLNWFRAASHMVDLGLQPFVMATVITKRAWTAVPAALRPELLAAAVRAERRLRTTVPDQDRKAVVEMQARGLTVTKVDAGSLGEWRAAGAALASSARGAIVPADAYDVAVSARAAFRKLDGLEPKGPR